MAKKNKNKTVKYNSSTTHLPKKERTYTYHETVIDIPKLVIDKRERENAIKLMRSIFEVQSKSYDTSAMREFLIKFIDDLNDDSIGYFVDASLNLYVTKGMAATYPCIVSHIDTVHTIIPDKDYVVLNSDTEFFAINLATRQSTGIGGDDNCGIYTCLDNLIREPYIKLAFFVDEEIGCVGSAEAQMEFFDDVSFVLQADRQGYQDVASDIMCTEMFGIDFLAKIEDTLKIYKREICEGGMTDVMQLAHNGLNVAMANFSCGYYEPHSRYEYVVIDELILTSIMFRDIIKDTYLDSEINEFIREDQYDKGYYNRDGSAKAWGDYDYCGYGTASIRNHNESTKVKPVKAEDECSFCGCQTTYDKAMELNFCNNCLDYDYNGKY